MNLRSGVYLVGPEGATIHWSDGSEQAFPPGDRIRFEPSDARTPRRIRGQLTRLLPGGPTYEAPERQPERA